MLRLKGWCYHVDVVRVSDCEYFHFFLVEIFDQLLFKIIPINIEPAEIPAIEEILDKEPRHADQDRHQDNPNSDCSEKQLCWCH